MISRSSHAPRRSAPRGETRFAPAPPPPPPAGRGWRPLPHPPASRYARLDFVSHTGRGLAGPSDRLRSTPRLASSSRLTRAPSCPAAIGSSLHPVLRTGLAPPLKRAGHSVTGALQQYRSTPAIRKSLSPPGRTSAFLDILKTLPSS